MSWAVPYFDLQLGEEEKQAAISVIRDNWLTSGPRIQEFETAFASALTTPGLQAVALSSCTAALHIAVQALDIGPGDEVICPSLSFVASANSIRYCGGTPVFSDIRSASDWNVDPDDLARTKGKQAIEDLLASAKGMLEALIQMSLDESFTQADAYEKQSRIAFVAKLIAEEDDPMLHAMAKGFTDMIAGRLDIVRSGEGAFRALENSVKQALAKAESERRRAEALLGQTTRHQLSNSDGNRISPRPPGTAERKAIVSVLIEWPVLLDDPEVADELSHLEGESVKVAAALRRAWNSADKKLDTDAFLAQMEPRVRAFAAERLADPETESETQAKVCLLENANKLKRLLLSQEAAEISRETYRAQGDSDAERELLRESQERLRLKHGLKLKE